MIIKPLDLTASQAEYDLILQALQDTNFNKSEAAKLLKIDRKTLYNKLNRYRKLKAKAKVSQDS